MGMGRGWAIGAGVVVAAVVLAGACSTEQERPKSPFSAGRLDDSDDETIADLLSPDERKALERSGVQVGQHHDEGGELGSTDEPTKDEPKSSFDRSADKAGKLGVALLSVGVTLGALAAPFFLF